MWALLVEARHKGIESDLLLEDIGRGRFGGLFLERQMHPLVPPVGMSSQMHR